MPTTQIDLTVANSLGLHARPSMKLIECIQLYKSTVSILYQGQEFVIDSLLDLIALCIPYGATITLKAEGKDADAVLEAVTRLGDFVIKKEC